MSEVANNREQKDEAIAHRSTLWLRIGVATIGIVGVLYGAKLLFSQQNVNRPIDVIKWAIGSDILTDGVILPSVMLIGWLLTNGVKLRARRYLQGGLIAIGMVLPVALIEIAARNASYVPLVHSAGKQNASKALLTQNYAGNLYLLIGIVGACTLVAYLWRLIRDQRPSR